ncbi:MAG: 1,4-dihydroxy-2-naphthoate polyprenyltransferase [Corynebacteriales bacterium]|nr:1,4-dihydroxy-2-naphthoate polyprenyltransferase [Mycobacteriales bacterium]
MTKTAASAPPTGFGLWVAGARPRTLPAAVVPVAVGTGVAAAFDGVIWWRALLALLVGLALQIGVNYANDYSDGIRGTDTERVGPLRLVGSGLVPAQQVKLAAFGSFAVAGLAGLVLTAVSGSWWLLLVGLSAVIAAWTYTGGPRPYGYMALGEVFVFIFFGLVAVCGTAFVQLEHLPALAWWVAVPVGLLACAMLMVNNIRDIPGDTAAGKRTLAVVLGEKISRRMYAATLALAFVLVALASAVGQDDSSPWLLLALLAIPLAVIPAKIVLKGAAGPALIPVLGATGKLQLAFGLTLTIGLVLS